MRRLALALALALPLAASAQDAAPARAPTGLAATFSIGAGGELGLDEGEGEDDAGVLELEAAIGFDIAESGVRPELAAAFGVAPDQHVALRPGLRLELPGYPIQLRAALDASNARDRDFGWRWFLVGAAAELRLTSILGLFAEVDTGFKLSSDAGLPLLVRAGASFRL